MANKKQKSLGQFYTTNSNYIMKGLLDIFPKNSTVVDPFAGNWDLLNLIKGSAIEGFDVDPKNSDTIKMDTLKSPPGYLNKWIITNPPYLSRNKNKDKTIYNKYRVDDLYKAALRSIIGCNGGAIIVPLNFLSSRDSGIRKEFLSKYRIVKLKIFEQQVFDDTSYTTCAFSFIKEDNIKQKVNAWFLPSNKEITFNIHQKDGFLFGAPFNKIININSEVKIGRLQKDKPVDGYITDMFLYAIDTGTKSGRIRLEINKNHMYGKVSDRAFATITCSKRINRSKQKIIVKEFNSILETYRKRYNSLFLTNYRNSTQNYARKRIDFSSAYGLIKYIMNEHNM